SSDLLSYTWNHMITSSAAYSHTRDLITQIIEVGEENSAYQTHSNLASQKDISVSVSGSSPICTWWSALTNINYFYRETFGKVNHGKDASLHLNSFQLYAQHTFTLPGDISLEIDGYYNSPSLWGGQFVSTR